VLVDVAGRGRLQPARARLGLRLVGPAADPRGQQEGADVVGADALAVGRPVVAGGVGGVEGDGVAVGDDGAGLAVGGFKGERPRIEESQQGPVIYSVFGRTQRLLDRKL
jgi:hypothetical protein